MAPASIVGAVVGAVSSGELPERVLLVAVAAVVAWQGVDLLARPFGEPPRDEPRTVPPQPLASRSAWSASRWRHPGNAPHPGAVALLAIAAALALEAARG